MILGELIPVPATTTLLYTDMLGNGAVGNLQFVNQGSDIDYIQIAVTTNYLNMPTNVSYLMYNAMVPINYTVVISEISLAQLQGLFVYSQNGTTDFTFVGNTF
jgi:hypothetical protein